MCIVSTYQASLVNYVAQHSMMHKVYPVAIFAKAVYFAISLNSKFGKASLSRLI